MDLAGEVALDQIDKKMYETGMRDRGIKKIIKLGMVFSGKSLRFYSCYISSYSTNLDYLKSIKI
ncbi:hypothetical protein [Cetobacterium sp.]|uniref:hypothetical protein n=1 Tax=Cetobacterium sp. TaxID=2071632 RepID=UPI003EE4DE68